MPACAFGCDSHQRWVVAGSWRCIHGPRVLVSRFQWIAALPELLAQGYAMQCFLFSGWPRNLRMAAEKAAEKAEASSRFGSQSRSLVKKWISTYASNGEQRVVCMRYSARDGCTSPTCRYEHLCPVLKPDGFPCLSAIRPGNTKVEAARGEEASFPGGRVLASSINRLATMLFVHAVMVVQPFLPRRGLWSMMAAGRVSCPVPVCPPALPQPPMPKLPGIPQSCQCRMCARVCVWL